MIDLAYYSDLIGIVGVVMVLIAYAMLQLNKISQRSFWFSFVNLLGSILILISLMYHWNLASVIIEISWLIISTFGVVKWLQRNKRSAGW